MDAKKNLSEAEKYRQERKERIKRDAKKTKGSSNTGNVIAKVVGWCFVAAFAVAAVWFFIWFFGLNVKMTTVGSVKVGDTEEPIKQTEFNYYYVRAFESVASSQQMYAQYGISGSYDFTKEPDAQKTKDDDGNEVTYAEFFKQEALENIEQVHYYAAKAAENNLKISDEDQKEIDEAIETAKTHTDRDGNKLSAGYVLTSQYGRGMTLSLYKKYVTQSYLAKTYTDHLNDTYVDEVSEDEIKAQFDESPETYEKVDLRMYGFEVKEAETDETTGEVTKEAKTAEEQTARAKEMISKVTDEDSFVKLILEYCEEDEKKDFEDPANSLASIDYDTVKNNMSEEDAKWAFSAERKAGDTSVWATSSMIYAIYIVNGAHKDEYKPVTVRHILVKFDENSAPDENVAEPVVVEPVTDEEGVTTAAEPESTEPVTHMDNGIAYLGAKHDSSKDEEVYKKTPATKEEAKEIAESYLELFKSGEQTEERFAELADLYSDDTGSTTSGNGSGGLYTDVTYGQMTQPFNEWIFNPARKTGDVEIVETTFGYHIIYFVDSAKYPAWEMSVRNDVASEKMEKEQEKQKTEYADSFIPGRVFDKAEGKALDMVTDLSKAYASQYNV